MESADPANEWLNYHHLRYFHAVAREGSVSRASEKLRTSQPSICAQVKQLEAALGETLYRRSGRSIVLTDFGRVIYGYAEEIFTLGRELLTTAKRAPTARTLRLHVGIVDSFPKLLSLDILRPVFAHLPRIQVTCQEGKIDDLLGQLAPHRLDALLADEPPPSGAQVRTYSHPLGVSGVTFCAAPALAKKQSGRFPRNLQGAPMLLPTHNTALRRDLEKWFRSVSIEPVVIGQFEDAALAKMSPRRASASPPCRPSSPPRRLSAMDSSRWEKLRRARSSFTSSRQSGASNIPPWRCWPARLKPFQPGLVDDLPKSAAAPPERKRPLASIR
jgi:LysR family transcriptional activator of nhaA